MTFINPYFLFGLIAVIIPVILHLFNLHKVKKMEFSTLMFLKEIQKSKLRRIRIKQLLLLILRILIIVFLVFAFSNPVYKGYLSGKNPDIRKCGIVVLDNSFSMSVKDDKGSYIEQAKKSVQNILKLYSPNDKLFLINSSRLKNSNQCEYKDVQSLIDSLVNIEMTCVPFTIPDILNNVKEIIFKDNFPLYEVFILSDFQKINLNSGNLDKDNFKDISRNVHLYNIDIGKREANNISIEKVEIKTKLIQNHDINISVILKNHNKFNALNKQVNLFIDDKKVAEAVVDLVSLERKEVILTYKSQHNGNSGGYAELLQNDFFEDEILQDNKSYFAYYIPEDINIGFMGDNDLSSKYIKLANIAADKLYNISGNKNIYKIIKTENTNDILKNSEMVIISDMKDFSEEKSGLLADYIKNGGGVLIFPGKKINVESYNAFFSKIDAFRIGELMKINSDTNIQNKFEKIDFEHPVFSDVFKNKDLSITNEKFFVESPKINYMYNIIPNKNSIVLMELAGGKIFLTESDFGEGKIIFCAVSASDDMSDFPMKSLFPLIINRCTFYLGVGANKNENSIVGKNNVVRFPKNKLYSIPYNVNYKEPGIYSLKNPATSENYLFALNRDSLESDLRKSEIKDIKDFFEFCGLKNTDFVDEQSDIDSVILKSREGLELWKYFVILALIFILLEMLYSKKLERM